jgi:hypothetical protein
VTTSHLRSLSLASPAVAELVDAMTTMPGAVAVVLGGSRAAGSQGEDSDWDFGVYYRGTLDLTIVNARGTVYPPGSWGRIMNGGAWLTCGNQKVDVLLRDLDVVEHWTRRAESGEFEVDTLLGYLAGIPTYTLTAELASCQLLFGDLPRAPFPLKLADTAPPLWRSRRSFSLEYARVLGRRGKVTAAVGHAAKAAIEEAHARVCEHRTWVCNEKGLLETAGLAGVNAFFTQIPSDSKALVKWIDRVADQLGAASTDAPSWKR